MSLEIILTFGVIFLAFIALMLDLWSPETILLGALAIVTAAGVISLERAVQGFSNLTLIALGSLYVVSAALRDSGALERASEIVLGRGTRNIKVILVRMCPSITVYSAFLNNTPIVAMGIPAIRSWARRYRVPASKLLMPLSFASILGGVCTLIGTSTNLVTHGLLEENGMEGFGFFELAWLGVPCAVLGLLYLIFISPLLTPARKDIREEEEHERKLLVELEVTSDSALKGKTVEEEGLDQFPGLQLSRINRGDQEIAPVSKDFELKPGDHLYYAAKPGLVSRAPDLTAYPGLRLVVQPPRTIEEEEERELHQAVVKEGSRLLGSTVEEARILERFGAAVTGVRRGGKRIEQPLGELILRPGDVLLLDTKRGFRGAFEDSEDFFITSEAGGEEPKPVAEPQEAREGGKNLIISVSVLLSIILLVTLGVMHIALAGMLGVAVLILTDVIDPGEARSSVDWSVLLVIAAALGLGEAMEASGAADILAGWIVESTVNYGSRAILAGVVITSTLVTNVITNNGAAALMFPIILSVAHSQGYDPRAFLIAMTLAASMAFITPIGYQTNLMVYGPGNYRFTDYFKVGMGLQVLSWIIIVMLAPVIWEL